MRYRDFERGNIFSLALSLSIPTMLSQAVNVLYSIIDRMFIGNIDQVGSLALAGVGVAAPITTFISSFAFLIGLGAAPMMAIKMGSKEDKEAHNIIYNGFVTLLILALCLTIFFYAFRKEVLTCFGSSDRTIEYAEAYFRIYVLGTPFAMLCIALNSFLINQGKSKSAMGATLLGAILNIALDPILIFYFSLGVKGAAYATVISQLATSILLLSLLRSKRTQIRITKGSLNIVIIRRICKIGLSPFIIMATDSLLMILLNTILHHYGKSNGDMLITASTIIQSYHLLVMNPLGGITGGSGGLISYNYGAGNSLRVKRAYYSVQTIATIYTSIIFILTYTIGDSFILLFTNDSTVAALTFKYLKIFTLMIIPLSFQYNNVDTFTALSKVEYALSFSLFRKLIFTLSLLLIPLKLPIGYVFFAEPISDLISAIVSTTIVNKNLSRLLKEREEKGLSF